MLPSQTYDEIHSKRHEQSFKHFLCDLSATSRSLAYVPKICNGSLISESKKAGIPYSGFTVFDYARPNGGTFSHWLKNLPMPLTSQVQWQAGIANKRRFQAAPSLSCSLEPQEPKGLGYRQGGLEVKGLGLI